MARAAVASVNVAEAKRRLSELLGRVAFGRESVLITRRGRPMARLVPLGDSDSRESLGSVRGWLEDDDPFFARVDSIVAARAQRRPRAYRGRRS